MEILQWCVVDNRPQFMALTDIRVMISSFHNPYVDLSMLNSRRVHRLIWGSSIALVHQRCFCQGGFCLLSCCLLSRKERSLSQ